MATYVWQAVISRGMMVPMEDPIFEMSLKFVKNIPNESFESACASLGSMTCKPPKTI